MVASQAGRRLGAFWGLVTGNSSRQEESPGFWDTWVEHVLEVPSFLGSMVGLESFDGSPSTGFTRGLGWLDVTLPGVVGLLMVVAVCAVIFVGLGVISTSKGLAWAILVVAVSLSALVPLWAVSFGDSYTMQPRYVLPFLPAVIGFALLPASGAGVRFSLLQRLLVVGSISIANSLALLAFARRFTNGQAVPFWNLDLIPSWWWVNSPVSVNTVWIVGSFSFLAAAAVAFGALGRNDINEAQEGSESPSPPDLRSE